MCYFCGNPLYDCDMSTEQKLFSSAFFPTSPPILLIPLWDKTFIISFSQAHLGGFVFTKLGAWTLYGLLEVKDTSLVEGIDSPPLLMPIWDLAVSMPLGSQFVFDVSDRQLSVGESHAPLSPPANRCRMTFSSPLAQHVMGHLKVSFAGGACV